VADAPAELTAKEKRAARERARRAVEAEERERIKAARAEKEAAPASAPAAATPAAPAAPTRTDEDRARDAAAFLRGVVFPVLALFAPLFGHRLELAAFSETAAAEDARSWVPLCVRYRWLDLLVSWATMPARLVARVRELARPKEPSGPAAKVVPLRGEERPAS
jgi:hypothetical protein